LNYLFKKKEKLLNGSKKRRELAQRIAVTDVGGGKNE
jgi:hypothetical protein